MNQYLVAIMSSIVTATFTWVISRQKSKAKVNKLLAETDTIKIKNVEAVVNFWKEQAEEFKKELQDLKQEHEKLYDKLEEVLHENGLLRDELAQVKKEMAILQANLKEQSNKS